MGDIKLKPTFEEDVFSLSYIYKKLDGKVSLYGDAVNEFLINNDIQDIKRRQGQFYQHIFLDLTLFERNLDQYELLMEKFNPSDKEFLFPNIDRPVNVLANIHIRRYKNLENSDMPKFSQETVDLVRKLDSISYEEIQILKKRNASLISKIIQGHHLDKDESNYILGEYLFFYLQDFPKGVEGMIKFIKTKVEGPNGLLNKYFDELNIEGQRKQRLRIGKELLYRMFEETKEYFEQNKKRFLETGSSN